MAEITRRDVLKIAATGAAAALPGLPRSARAQGTQKRELVVAQGGDIAALDPHLSTSSNDIRISFNIFDNLTSRRPDGKLVPGLATEWKLQGQTTWVFKLRSGVKLHNGDPLTSADVKFSIDRSLDTSLKGNRVNTVLTTVERVETPDPEPPSSTPRSRTRCCRRAWASTAARSSRRNTSRRSARTPSTRSPSAPARRASCRGRRTTSSCSRPTRTTGAAASTSIASS